MNFVEFIEKTNPVRLTGSQKELLKAYEQANETGNRPILWRKYE